MSEKKANTNDTPIIVGVTGHRNLCDDEIDIIYELVGKELYSLRKQFPHSRCIMLNSLAEGADQLCAKVGLEEGFELIVPLPMPLSEYEKDFTGKALNNLHELTKKADRVFAVPGQGSHENDRDSLYRLAGIYVAEHCNILLALWDGTPATPAGCGTAEIVDYRLNRSHPVPEGASLSLALPPVLHVFVNRQGNERTEAPHIRHLYS